MKLSLWIENDEKLCAYSAAAVFIAKALDMTLIRTGKYNQCMQVDIPFADGYKAVQKLRQDPLVEKVEVFYRDKYGRWLLSSRY
jgi:hypothetical protein